ncbi:MAG: hypothetical protein AW10_01152 [Candidatus Accumulibacter appositus]|uniref:HEAT repeat domain-containing protein n=1 Tax=Candidatus Accumulibacter appositus TaxID=1454003 RepID=A0A011PX34_9PROT|nr:PhzF family phenazine biosynthesis protein [Accumulibacter sp.]EXI81420.1 MAG: hypothetical protein AW10_01152 [Candidatus Accumulibacter appositus]
MNDTESGPAADKIGHPVTAVDLCGHATLATAHVIFEHLAHARPQITSVTRSGNLHVRRQACKSLSRMGDRDAGGENQLEAVAMFEQALQA